MPISPSKKRVGLALGSGAARGLAHIGVLYVLKKHDIQIDMIAGTSMGSLVGAVYARGEDIDRMKSTAIGLGSKRISLFMDPVLPKYSLIRGQKIKNMLESLIGDVEYQDLEIPFACSATNIGNGQEVMIREGMVWKGVRASCSVPIIMSPVKLGGRYLVDGGLVDPVPVRVLREMGADFIIAVNVTQNVTQVGRGIFSIADNKNKKVKKPAIVSIATQMIGVISSQSLKSSLVGADVIIAPQVSHINWGDFHRARECILQGELAARDSLAEIQRLLAV